MNFKKTFQNSVFLFLTLFILPLQVFAYSNYIIPGGENIGIELHSKGILVVGFYEVNGSYPNDLKVGDKILKIEGIEVANIQEMVHTISQYKDSIKVTYERNEKSYETTIPLFEEDGVTKTGLYVKDQINGIGTLTYIDPETKLFGALGHEILEKTTGKILEIKDGKIYDSTVTSITKSENGNPGEKNAKTKKEEVEGTITENTKHGIFGTYSGSLDGKTYKVANPEDIKLGSAKIRTVLNGKEIGEYSIQITKINPSDTTKNLSFTITDEELLNSAGGIVQGMSGSPILQDDYIIGAITHVVVDSPTKGYGIFITNMLEEAEN